MHTAIPANGRLTIIVSAEREYRSDDANHGYHCLLRKHVAKHVAHGELYSMHECEGAYKGTPERSIAFTGPVGITGAIGRRLGEAFMQESILAIAPSGKGELIFMDHQPGIALGQLAPCDADQCEAWTRILATDETFTFV